MRKSQKTPPPKGKEAASSSAEHPKSKSSHRPSATRSGSAPSIQGDSGQSSKKMSPHTGNLSAAVSERRKSSGVLRSDQLATKQTSAERSSPHDEQLSPKSLDELPLRSRNLQNVPSRLESPPYSVERTRSSISESSDATIRGNVSPTLEAAFYSPQHGALHTTSTASTDSTRTVRGTTGQTQSQVRTPSYPFPYMPRSYSKAGPTPLHQPFTALSPTSASPDASQQKQRDKFLAQGGQRMANLPSFTPKEQETPSTGEGLYPSPNLYNAVLELNSESLLQGWSSKLVELANGGYHMNRISLSLPLDPTDLEGVQWGQKLSYNLAGLKSSLTSSNLQTASSSTSARRSTSRVPEQRSGRQSSSTHPVRPSIESRHSFAGYEVAKASTDENSHARPVSANRPTLGRRITSQTPSDTLGVADQLSSETQYSLQTPSDDPPSSESQETRHSSQEDQYFSIHRTLRPLNAEEDPLLDPASVNRVIDRGSMILLTRNFTTEENVADNKNAPGQSAFSKSRQSSVIHDSSASTLSVPVYEDYEQRHSAPWSESPSPSPAIQNDPERNPFFEDSTKEASSFEPDSNLTDYSKDRPIEAIGVDNAYTVIHLPLIHPSLSKVKSDESGEAVCGEKEEDPMHPHESSSPSQAEKKMPIAILSFSSPLVPYPSNLAKSLTNLGPHLATSYNTCSRNSQLQKTVSRAIRQKQKSGKFLDVPQYSLDFGLGLGLDGLLYDDLETGSSTVASVHSPSEYSAGSLNSTPGVDPSHLTPGTKGSMSERNSYFEGLKHNPVEQTYGSSGATQSHSKSPSNTKTPVKDHRSILARTEMSPRARGSPSPADPSLSSLDQRLVGSPGAPDSQHSLLHSFGADFKASFQALPPATQPTTPGRSRIVQGFAPHGDFSMPPPSERLLRMIIDGLPVQIFLAAPTSGKLTWVNSKFLHYRGLSAEDILSDPWGTIHNDDLEGYLQAWWRSLHTGDQFQHKVRLKRYDGEDRYFYVRAIPLRTNEQRIVHWLGTMFDFHDQHIAEVSAAQQQETAASEEKYRALANSSPQIVFAVSRKRGITFCNSQWTAYSGQTEQEARGIGFLDCVHPDDAEKCKLPEFGADENASNVPISLSSELKRTGPVTTPHTTTETSEHTVVASPTSPGSRQMPQRKLSELANTGILRVSRDGTGKPSYSTEVRLKTKNGEYKWHLVRVLLADPLIQQAKEEESWYGTCTDISDHKELERSLKEAMETKSNFLSNMSHEIRTPLNGIWGMTNFLIDTNLTGEQLDQVNVIRASTEGLRDLINDILDLSKAEAGMITLNLDWFNIRSVIEEVNDITCPLALDKRIDLNYLVEKDVPSILKGDKFRFRQILINVIGNGIKFTDNGEVFIHCTVVPEVPEDFPEDHVMLEVQVRDTGQGFSEKEAERLFKRFSQIDGSSTRQHGGSGLGLVISMQLAELHGGAMTASSTLGKGSTFSFTIAFGVSSKETAPMQASDDSVVNTPSTRLDRGRFDSQMFGPVLSQQSPLARVMSESPSAAISLSPSSAGSDPSMHTAKTSIRSSISSQSSRGSTDAQAMKLELKPGSHLKSHSISSTNPSGMESKSIQPLIYSIMVVCPLPWMQEAIVGHLHSILPKNVAHTVTARSALAEVRRLIKGEDSVIFSHIILATQDTDAAASLIDEIFASAPISTTVVVVSDVKQRNLLFFRSGPHNYIRLGSEKRLQFIQKPVKPSKLAVVFDPSRSAELSTDPNQSSAQQIAISQKQLFEEMTRRLADRDLRVLLVEDNAINQMVMLKLLQRISVGVETVMDGVQATEKVLSKPAGYYSIILMDLMMPNKDGYKTCHDIREWETANGYSQMPIIALSANVLDDVWRRCKDAGFNSYLTKPVEFQELSDTMMAFLDPEEDSKPKGFMQSAFGGGRKAKKG